MPGTIADIIMRSGDAQAQAAQQQGNMLGDLFTNLGQTIGQGLQARAAAQAAGRRDAAWSAYLESGEWTRDPKGMVAMSMRTWGPELGTKMAQTLASAATMTGKGDAEDEKRLIGMLPGVLAQSDELLARQWPFLRQLTGPTLASRFGIKPEQLPEQWDPKLREPMGLLAQYHEQQKAATREVKTVDDQGAPVTRIVEDKPGQVFQAPQAEPKKLTPEESHLAAFAKERGKTVEQLTAAEMEQARKGYAQAGRMDVNLTGIGGLYQDVDPKAIAQAIKNGEQPPEISQLGRPAGAAVASILAKEGFNLAAAATDWKATQRHIATLNGSQQVRMTQAIDNAAHSLDVIDELAQQWRGGRFPALNKVQLAAAKAGALGPEAQGLAVKLEAQIADVTSELGNVYMGGNSPTDHALKLAAHNLSADWSETTLRAMTDLGRKNLQIRANSMRNVGVAGASAGNPYAPKAAPAAVPSPAAPAPGGPPRIRSRAEYEQLHPGTTYIAPDGTVRVKG